MRLKKRHFYKLWNKKRELIHPKDFQFKNRLRYWEVLKTPTKPIQEYSRGTLYKLHSRLWHQHTRLIRTRALLALSLAQESWPKNVSLYSEGVTLGTLGYLEVLKRIPFICWRYLPRWIRFGAFLGLCEYKLYGQLSIAIESLSSLIADLFL